MCKQFSNYFAHYFFFLVTNNCLFLLLADFAIAIVIYLLCCLGCRLGACHAADMSIALQLTYMRF